MCLSILSLSALMNCLQDIKSWIISWLSQIKIKLKLCLSEKKPLISIQLAWLRRLSSGRDSFSSFYFKWSLSSKEGDTDTVTAGSRINMKKLLFCSHSHWTLESTLTLRAGLITTGGCVHRAALLLNHGSVTQSKHELIPVVFIFPLLKLPVQQHVIVTHQNSIALNTKVPLSY